MPGVADNEIVTLREAMASLKTSMQHQEESTRRMNESLETVKNEMSGMRSDFRQFTTQFEQVNKSIGDMASLAKSQEERIGKLEDRVQELERLRQADKEEAERRTSGTRWLLGLLVAIGSLCIALANMLTKK